MIAPKSTVNRVLPPVGTHIGRVIEIIYLGTQKVTWKGQDKELFKVRIKWELPLKKHVFKEGDKEKPFVVNSEYTLSMGSKANLRPIVEGIIGVSLKDEEANAYDLDDLLGQSCLVSITHKEGESGKYVIVNTTSPLMEGQTCPPPFNAIRILSFDKWNEEFFTSLPDFIKDKITSSKEYKKMKGLVPVVSATDDMEYPADEHNSSEIPF